MELGIIARTWGEEPFAMAKARGLSFLEYCVNVNSNYPDFENASDAILDFSKKYGIKIGSIGRWGADKITPEGQIIEEELALAYRYIDQCVKLGSPVYVTGCNYVEGLSYYQNITCAIAFFKKVVEYASGKGVKVALYNCDWNNFLCCDPAWDLILGEIPELGIKFDPSHSRYGGRDYLAELAKWVKRVYHVHIKGSLIIDGKRFDDPPAGLDQTDWGSLMAVLYAGGYDGGLSIEPHSGVWLSGGLGESGVDYTVKYMKKLIF